MVDEIVSVFVLVVIIGDVSITVVSVSMGLVFVTTVVVYAISALRRMISTKKPTLEKIGVVERVNVFVVNGEVLVFTSEVVTVNGIVLVETSVVVEVRVIGIVDLVEPIDITEDVTGQVVVVMVITF